ncbi:MAG: flagellar assembly protein FliW [Pirellulales bacterium]|jgi:flagellar assembly factor FliW|nr:flagellar assembly protein FliW [Pirellulales bacterium]
MLVKTTRFGTLEIDPTDVIVFPLGLVGLESCREWVLLGDSQNEALAWLQCTTRPDLALAVVSPRRFVEDYQLRVFRSELAPLALDSLDQAQVLAIVSHGEQGVCLNLQAPLVINLPRRLGRQVVANGELPLQYPLVSHAAPVRKSA